MAKQRTEKSSSTATIGIEADFGPEHADTFRRELRADYILANPPFNDSDWFRKADGVRLQMSRSNFNGQVSCH